MGEVEEWGLTETAMTEETWQTKVNCFKMFTFKIILFTRNLGILSNLSFWLFKLIKPGGLEREI